MYPEVEFPSPYGVSFILTNNCNNWEEVEEYFMFPSPYGVSFILTKKDLSKYSCYWCVLFPSPYGVSFILTELWEGNVNAN